jgi:hypothetical protein
MRMDAPPSTLVSVPPDLRLPPWKGYREPIYLRRFSCTVLRPTIQTVVEESIAPRLAVADTTG